MTLEEMKRIKKERGFSMAQLSEYSGVPMGTLQKIFSWETENPRYATRQALEKALMDGGEGYLLTPEHVSMVKEPGLQYGSHHKRPGEYTLEDYYTLPEERRAELIDGVIYDMSAPTFVHQRIL